MTDIKELILTKEQISEIVQHHCETHLAYADWMKTLEELVTICEGEIPPSTGFVDKLAYISRKAYLNGFYHGLDLFNDTVKSYIE